MKVSSLISTAPKRLPGGSTVNNLAKVIEAGAKGSIIGLGTTTVFNSLRSLGIPIPTGTVSQVASAAVVYKATGQAGLIFYLLTTGALTGLMGSASATGTPAQKPRMTEVY